MDINFKITLWDDELDDSYDAIVNIYDYSLGCGETQWSPAEPDEVYVAVYREECGEDIFDSLSKGEQQRVVDKAYDRLYDYLNSY